MTEGKPGFPIKDVGNDRFTFLEFRYRFYEYGPFAEESREWGLAPSLFLSGLTFYIQPIAKRVAE